MKFQEIGINGKINIWIRIMLKRTVMPVTVAICLSLIFSSLLEGQVEEKNDFDFSSSADLPVDPDVILGKLKNGLSYYIRANFKPENRAQVWLVVNAGSVLEDEDQRGLAHFLEHMAFNGTENFAKHEIIDYLESIGMKFGPEINAFTGFDETVYMLQLPTDSSEVLETGFRILGDWASGISLDSAEIEKERGVVIEEWRLGRGADMRMLDQQLPVILKGSKYARRLPIGDRDLLETFEHGSLKRFYDEWYRPDLMAIVAVGDFEAGYIKGLIEDQFSGLSVGKAARVRKVFPVPEHAETLFALATDPEATSTMISVYYKQKTLPENTVGDYRRMLVNQLFSRMLNIRLYELLNQAEPPYLYAFASQNSLVRSGMMYSLNVAVKEDAIERGFTDALTEAERVREHGFTPTELERTKEWLLRRIEQSHEESDKTESGSYASEYMRNFLEDEPIPGISFEFEITKALLPGISLEEVNAMAEKWFGTDNRVVLLNAPEKEGLEIPDEAGILSLFRSVEASEVQAYEDEGTSRPLMEELSTRARVVDESYREDLDINLWELSNGIRVILKSTDFKNDEIHFQGFSPGGHSLVPDSLYRTVRAAPDIVSLSGLGDFDINSLNKKMTGKVVSVFPYINELTEGVVGNASPRDIETMFQLIYLYLTRPREDPSAYLSYKARMQGFIENRSGSPESAFYDTIHVTVGNYHFRERPWTMSMLDEIDSTEIYDIYRERLANLGDFTFVIVGNFNADSIRPLVETYLGSLPSKGHSEKWQDIGNVPPKGVIKKTVYRGMEPKSRVRLVFSGDARWDREGSYAMGSMADVLSIKLREVLREDLSGTYGTSVSASLYRDPREEYRINISFGCNPERVEELTSTVLAVIDSLKTYPVGDEYINKVSESQRRSYETSLKRNRFWLSGLVSYSFRGQDPGLILEYPDLVDSLTSGIIQETARKYFSMHNYIQVVLKPKQNLPEPEISDRIPGD